MCSTLTILGNMVNFVILTVIWIIFCRYPYGHTLFYETTKIIMVPVQPVYDLILYTKYDYIPATRFISQDMFIHHAYPVHPELGGVVGIAEHILPFRLSHVRHMFQIWLDIFKVECILPFTGRNDDGIQHAFPTMRLHYGEIGKSCTEILVFYIQVHPMQIIRY